MLERFTTCCDAAQTSVCTIMDTDRVLEVSERSFMSEQQKKVIYGQVKHGKRRNNRK